MQTEYADDMFMPRVREKMTKASVMAMGVKRLERVNEERLAQADGIPAVDVAAAPALC